MNKEREALRLALEALDNLLYWDNGKSDYDQAREAITAIKEASAQPIIQNYLEKDNSQPERIKWSDYEPDGRRIPLTAYPAQELPPITTGYRLTKIHRVVRRCG